MRTICALVILTAHASALEGFANSQRDKWIARDKAEHFTAGVVIGSIADTLAAKLTPQMGRGGRFAYAIGMAVVAGTLKEVYDARHPRNHDASVKDAAWTYAGGAAGCVAVEWTFRW